MTQHPADPMTPEWSRALAQVGQSPYWGGGLTGMERCQAFVGQASAYSSLADLPDSLKTVYQRAMHAMHAMHIPRARRS